ncbi:hypothetical protein PFISCL1PPCAC_15889, partial [Pristionchus fissidentatus]
SYSMNARDEIGRQLNALMGVSRNGQIDESTVYQDRKHCRQFLAIGWCMNKELQSTRLPNEMCLLEHDESVRKLYFGSPEYYKLNWEKNAYDHLQTRSLEIRHIIRDHVRKFKGITTYGGETDDARMSAAEHRIEMAKAEIEITARMAQAAVAAENGDIAGVDAACDAADAIKNRLVTHQALHNTNLRSMELASSNSVCETCNQRLDPSRPADVEHAEMRVHKTILRMNSTIDELFIELDRRDEEWGKKELKRRALAEQNFLIQQTEKDLDFEKRAEAQYRMGRAWLSSPAGLEWQVQPDPTLRREAKAKKEERERERESSDRRRGSNRERERNYRDRDYGRREERRRSRSPARRRSRSRDRRRSRSRDRGEDRRDYGSTAPSTSRQDDTKTSTTNPWGW